MTLHETIDALLWEDESTTLDFKQNQYPFATDEQKDEIIKDLLAFANTFRRNDAYILIGIPDTKGGRRTITAITHYLDESPLQQLVNSKTNRTIEFSYHAITIDNKSVGILRIPRQPRPSMLNLERKPRRELSHLVRRGNLDPNPHAASSSSPSAA
jgi:predicted HTH transcriptional regulator